MIGVCDQGVQCHHQASCHDVDGSPVCICNNGFEGDGFDCNKSIPPLIHVSTNYCANLSSLQCCLSYLLQGRITARLSAAQRSIAAALIAMMAPPVFVMLGSKAMVRIVLTWMSVQLIHVKTTPYAGIRLGTTCASASSVSASETPSARVSQRPSMQSNVKMSKEKEASVRELYEASFSTGAI